MKILNSFITGVLLLLTSISYASAFETYFCISDQGKPKHCNEGDIIMVKPTMVPRVCDFKQQILRMPKGENVADYLCRYTGKILAVKELKSRSASKVKPQVNNVQQQPRKNKMFDKMPFFK